MVFPLRFPGGQDVCPANGSSLANHIRRDPQQQQRKRLVYPPPLKLNDLIRIRMTSCVCGCHRGWKKKAKTGLAFTLEKEWSGKQNDVLPLASVLLHCYKKLFISLNTTPTLLSELMQQCHVITFFFLF